MRETHLDERTVHHGTCEHLRLRTCCLFVLQILLTDLTEAKSLLTRHHNSRNVIKDMSQYI